MSENSTRCGNIKGRRNIMSYGYAPNVVSAGDIVIINGVRFKVKYDFNLAKGDKNLLLKRESEPNMFIAQIEKK